MPPALPPAVVEVRAGISYPAVLALGAASERADWIERAARWMIDQDPTLADAMIDDLRATALAEWRLQHAALWQWVRFRARFIRAAHRDD
jgi:hypothetical protein